MVRIVKMTFKNESISQFKTLFESQMQRIRNFDGCTFLALYQDKNKANIFFTYSHWKSEQHLSAYRSSQLFKNVWGQTKPLFEKKAEAWSADPIVTLT